MLYTFYNNNSVPKSIYLHVLQQQIDMLELLDNHAIQETFRRLTDKKKTYF